MSSYYTPSKGIVNRYWKRPKPRVYECNIRDAERFYQQSYKDYLEAKEYAAKRAAEDRSRIGEDTSSRWGIRRSNSLIETGSDPLSTLLTSGSLRQYGEESFSGSSTFRPSASKPDTDMATIEERLQRLQRLKSELGLPVENAEGGYGASTQKVTFRLPSSTGRDTSPPAIRERRGKTVDMLSSSSYSTSARKANRSIDSDLTSDSYLDKFASGTDKSLRFLNKYNNDKESYVKESRSRPDGRASSNSRDDPDKYSYKSLLKSERKYENSDDAYSFKPSARNERSYETNEESYSYKPSTKNERRLNATSDDYSFKPSDSKMSAESTSTFKSTRKAAAINDDDDCDADAYLNSIKKKFPTSEEILERIKKMDSDM